MPLHNAAEIFLETDEGTSLRGSYHNGEPTKSCVSNGIFLRKEKWTT